MLKHKFVIVSNRLPVSVSRHNGKLVFRASSGGLATAMSSVGGEKLWIGWPGIPSDDLTATEKAAITRTLKKDGYYPVFLTQEQIDKFYDGYSNDTLWPLFHYFQSYAKYDSTYWDAYKQVNAIYKKAVMKMADESASVWVHDYHLMLLPQLLRRDLPKSTIGFFLHIPFPSYEIFRMLPNRRQVLEGLVGADLIGFHTYDYARHFLSSTQHILGIENNHGTLVVNGRVVRADAFPIGIDYPQYVEKARTQSIQQKAQDIRDHYAGKKIILSAGDRLDYSKGILKRLEAFEQFLRVNPKHHKKVVLVMHAAPSRMDVDTYKELREKIEQLVARINGHYSTVDWTPISYQFKALTVDELIPMFIAADVALVTPLRDGMNLVAKEYVAVKQKSPGVLILSEMAGAIDEMPEALRINPNNIDSIVAALHVALRMSKREQLERLALIQRRLSRYTVQKWASDFMEQLESTKLQQHHQSGKLLTTELQEKILRQFTKARKRLILLDYDGTLKPFVTTPNPKEAAPPRSLLNLIRHLTDLPYTKVGIISGRPREALNTWFAGLPVSLAAEHGAWMKYNGDWMQQPVSLHEHKKTIIPVMEHYAERTPGAVVEEKDFALVWHYRSVPTELAHARNASLRYELNQLTANTDLMVYSGAKIIEVKPRSVHKGTVAEDLIALHDPDFILCLGDDYTDEAMFQALPDEAFSIKVGLGETDARYQVASVKEALSLLKKISEDTPSAT